MCLELRGRRRDAGVKKAVAGEERLEEVDAERGGVAATVMCAIVTQSAISRRFCEFVRSTCDMSHSCPISIQIVL